MIKRGQPKPHRDFIFIFSFLTLLACLKIIEKRVKITIFYMLHFKILN